MRSLWSFSALILNLTHPTGKNLKTPTLHAFCNFFCLSLNENAAVAVERAFLWVQIQPWRHSTTETETVNIPTVFHPNNSCYWKKMDYVTLLCSFFPDIQKNLYLCAPLVFPWYHHFEGKQSYQMIQQKNKRHHPQADSLPSTSLLPTSLVKWQAHPLMNHGPSSLTPRYTARNPKRYHHKCWVC